MQTVAQETAPKPVLPIEKMLSKKVLHRLIPGKVLPNATALDHPMGRYHCTCLFMYNLAFLPALAFT